MAAEGSLPKVPCGRRVRRGGCVRGSGGRSEPAEGLGPPSHVSPGRAVPQVGDLAQVFGQVVLALRLRRQLHGAAEGVQPHWVGPARGQERHSELTAHPKCPAESLHQVEAASLAVKGGCPLWEHPWVPPCSEVGSGGMGRTHPSKEYLLVLGMSMMSMKPLFPAKGRVEVAQPSSKRMWAWGSASSWGKKPKK